jgi:hypothetical protein
MPVARSRFSAMKRRMASGLQKGISGLRKRPTMSPPQTKIISSAVVTRRTVSKRKSWLLGIG